MIRGLPVHFLNRNQFGGRLGGPIIKNKAFFFFLYDGQRYLSKQETIGTVLTPEARTGIFRYLTAGAPVSPEQAAETVMHFRRRLPSICRETYCVRMPPEHRCF